MNDHSRSTIKACRDALISGFVWRHTEQGHTFWSEIDEALYELEQTAQNN